MEQGDPAPPAQLYGLEEEVPPATALVVSLQHVAAMAVGTVTPPLIVARALDLPPEDAAYLVSTSLLASALGSALQTKRRGVLGSGLLSVTGTSFAFLQPLLQAGRAGGLPLMLGASLVTAPVQVALAPFVPKLRRVITPVVSGVVVLLIGLSLIPSAMNNIATPIAPGGGSGPSAAIALLVVGLVVAMQLAGRPWARLASVPVGVTLGWIAAAALGAEPPPTASSSAWLTIPRLLPHGFDVRADRLLPFAFVYVVSSLEAVGDMTATAQLSGLDTTGEDHWRRIRGGVLADGVTCLASALFGALPSTTYAQNNGIIQITGVCSRRIGWAIASILAVLGLVPAVGRWVTGMPPPVLGALAVLLFGLVAVSGLRLIARSGLSHRDALLIALSLAVGLGVPSQPRLVAALPEALRAVFESTISAGGLTALVLNAVMPRVSSRCVQK